MDLKDYHTIDQAATLLGKTRATIERWKSDAQGTEYDLGDPDGEFPIKVWHISKWRRLEASRLDGPINEAIALGLVVRSNMVDELQGISWEKGWEEGYAEGRDARREDIAVEPDSELAEANEPAPASSADSDKLFNLEGLTVGGFTSFV